MASLPTITVRLDDRVTDQLMNMERRLMEALSGQQEQHVPEMAMIPAVATVGLLLAGSRKCVSRRELFNFSWLSQTPTPGTR